MTSGKKSESGKNAEFFIKKIRERLMVRGMREPVKNKLPRSCPKKEIFLRAFMGEMTAEEHKNFLDHTAFCPTCRNLSKAMTQLQAELKAREKTVEDRRVPAAEREGLTRLAKGRLREISGKRVLPILKPLSASSLLLAAAVLVFLGCLLLMRAHVSDQALRGAPQEELRLIQPEGKLERAPSALVWTDIKKREGYGVEIIDDELNLLYQDTTPNTRLELPSEVKQKIVRGRVYLWTVEARDEDNNIQASASLYFEIE
jgi:hypothetical protein